MPDTGKHSRLVLAALTGVALSGCATAPQDAAGTAIASSCAERLSGPSAEIALSVTAEEGRKVPVTLFVPEQPGTYPVIAFSHGAFASPTRYRAVLAPLAAAGYIVVAPMHVDSEEFGSSEQPSPDTTWLTRNLDMALALEPGAEIRAALAERGLSIDPERLASTGHSYGAIIAQQPGGALAIERDGSQVDRANPAVDVVVGWSPPGIVPGMIAAEGWSTLSTPTLTITGTTDILPGFIDDWRMHGATYDHAPVGNRALWIGEGVDHYFGGVFGREKPADENSRAMFARALATSLNFVDRHVEREDVCLLGAAIAGETYQEDQ